MADSSMWGNIIQAIAAAYAAREATKQNNKNAEAASQPKWSYQSPYGANLINPMMPLLMSEALKMYQARSSGSFWGGDKNKNWGFQPNNDAISKIVEIMNPYLQNPQSYDPFGGVGGGPGSPGSSASMGTWTRPGSFPDAPVKSAEDAVNEGIATQNPDGTYSRVPGALGQNNRDALQAFKDDLVAGRDTGVDRQLLDRLGINAGNAYELTPEQMTKLTREFVKFGGGMVPGGSFVNLISDIYKGGKWAAGKLGWTGTTAEGKQPGKMDQFWGKVNDWYKQFYNDYEPHRQAGDLHYTEGPGEGEIMYDPVTGKPLLDAGGNIRFTGTVSTEPDRNHSLGTVANPVRFQDPLLDNLSRSIMNRVNEGRLFSNRSNEAFFGIGGAGGGIENPYQENPWDQMGGHNAF